MSVYPEHGGPPVLYQPGTINTVVIQQPGVGERPLRDWNSGVCACFDDCKICLCGTFCGTCLLMRNAKRLKENCCIPCYVPYAFTAMRVKLRTQENIIGSIDGDCCMEMCCFPCANCQMARELKYIKKARKQAHHSHH
ncbi:placenta-specific gene 8 protein-like [Physella acuta]|uniref:placenta-specific gene 8 protein-like n=1 Tax=Physella acuta TaxID=109671 RepID=UPI0027DCF05B|nr:placenta-specific gene 8 protein-like [Physella acuta]